MALKCHTAALKTPLGIPIHQGKTASLKESGRGRPTAVKRLAALERGRSAQGATEPSPLKARIARDGPEAKGWKPHTWAQATLSSGLEQLLSTVLTELGAYLGKQSRCCVCITRPSVNARALGCSRSTSDRDDDGFGRSLSDKSRRGFCF